MTETGTRRSTVIVRQYRGMNWWCALIMWLTRPYVLLVIRVGMGELNRIQDHEARINAAMITAFISQRSKLMEMTMMFASILLGILMGVVLAQAVFGNSQASFYGGYGVGAGVGFLIIWAALNILRDRPNVQRALDELGYVKCHDCGSQYNEEIPCGCGHLRRAEEVIDSNLTSDFIARLERSR